MTFRHYDICCVVVWLLQYKNFPPTLKYIEEIIFAGSYLKITKIRTLNRSKKDIMGYNKLNLELNPKSTFGLLAPGNVCYKINISEEYLSKLEAVVSS